MVTTENDNVGIFFMITHPDDRVTRSRNFSSGYGPDEPMLSPVRPDSYANLINFEFYDV